MTSKFEPTAAFYSDQIEQALDCWSRGGLVALPTETVYGLGAPVNSEKLIQKIFTYKERPFYDPLIVHVDGLKMAKSYAHWDTLSEKLAKAFWPGPLTIILPKKTNISDLITSGLGTVGLRCPDNELSLKLISKSGVGVAAPSANKFTKTSPTRAEHVMVSFQDNFLCILKDDHCAQVGIESTILQVEDQNTIKVLRPGMVTVSQIKEKLDLENLTFKEGVTAVEASDAARLSPGTESIHYRPEYPLFLVDQDKPMSTREDLAGLKEVKLNSDPLICAREIYSVLRVSLEREFKGKVILVPKRTLMSQHHQEQWRGILNRLSKAGKWLN